MSGPARSPLGVVAHYNLLERMDPSGPGDLYRARDTRLGRTVAVRLLPAVAAPDRSANAALIERTRPLLKVSHPNITTVFDVGEHEGRVFVVFEFLRGQSIRAEMGGRAMNVRRAVELAIQIADAVAEAHALGFVHGGLSPDSIVVTAKGHAKIPASEHAAHGGFEETSSGSRLRDYESPEEAQGQPADSRGDIYSVGAVLFEMLTTRRPHPRGAAAASASNPHVPSQLDDVVLKALAPNPQSRHQSAATLASELRAVIAGLDATGDGGDEDESAASRAGRGRVVAVVVGLLAAAAAVAWWVMRS